MGSKKFIIQLIFRIVLLLIVLSIISSSYFLLDPSQLIFTFIVLFSLLGIQLFELINFLTKTNREISRFLLSLKHSDFQLYYSNDGTQKPQNELYETFNSIINSFKSIKIEKESQFEFLRLIVEQVKIGIIALNEHHEIILMNSFSENLLGCHKTKNWAQLQQKRGLFCKEVDELKAGGNKLIELSDHKQLSVNVSHSILLNKPHRIITFQNIKNEIELKETEAWIRLIRILNHEIMNSVTPISSLTETILLILEDKETPITTQKIEDVISCVKTIQKRSDGLFDFVTEYRKLTKIPTPKKENVSVSVFFENIQQLWKSEIDKKQIQFRTEIIGNNDTIFADPHLLDQVLINLIKNSIQALEGIPKPKLTLSFSGKENNSFISIADNGIGIPEELINDIFVPFFTTKEKGSGIGLSLSRQIMRMHNGSISVQSIPSKETIFTLKF